MLNYSKASRWKWSINLHFLPLCVVFRTVNTPTSCYHFQWLWGKLKKVLIVISYKKEFIFQTNFRTLTSRKDMNILSDLIRIGSHESNLVIGNFAIFTVIDREGQRGRYQRHYIRWGMFIFLNQKRQLGRTKGRVQNWAGFLNQKKTLY